MKLRSHLRQLAAAVSLVAAACAGAPGAQPSTASGSAALAGQVAGRLRFARAVAPFPVFDESGREYLHPFLGGTVAPRPQLVDIDGDGDLDLFVQEYTNDLWHFENVGSRAEPRFVWRTSRYQELDIGEWYRFADLDGDGLIDLLSEEPFSHIRHYRNQGTRADPRFVRVDSLRDHTGAAIFMDRQNIPALVDIDCNGRLDLFVGRVEGIVTRYEAERPGAARFTLLTDFWEGIEIIGTPEEWGTSRHGANALAFADFEGDGDADLFWGDFFEPGVLLIENVGPTCSSASLRVEPVLLPAADSVRTSGYNAPAPADLDGDGRLDFLMGVLGGAFNPVTTSAHNFHHWARQENGRFQLRTRRFLDGIDVGSESVPAVVDLDGDGLLDLVVGSKIDPVSQTTGLLFFFKNEGTRTAPRLRLADTLRVATAYHQAPAFGDLNADGLPDLLLGTWEGEVLTFRNNGRAGAPNFVSDSSATLRLPRGSNATPALADIDQDGDLDLFVGQSNGAVTQYRNDGSASTARFVLVSETLGGSAAGRRSAPAFVDVDGDGQLDLVVGREDRGASFYRNSGTRVEPRFPSHEALGVPLPPLSAPAFADLNGDGTPDLIAGTASGGVVWFAGVRN